MTHAALLKQIQQWHADGQHEKVEDAILALPEAEWKRDYDLSCMLARAFNNLSRYQEALEILKSFHAQGQTDALWHFRVGYSLYYLEGREAEAIPYFERAIALGDDGPDSYQMLLWAKEAAKKHWEPEAGNKGITGKFDPKAFATIALNMRLRPDMRARCFEDGLDLMLRSKGLGIVSGGGSLLSPEGEVESCDVEMDLVDDSEETRRAVLAAAEKLEAAKGSKLKYRYAGDRIASEHPIGKLEGFAVYLNGTDLPEEVYRDNKLQDVYGALIEALSRNGALVRSYWRGPRETALYFYGEGGIEAMLAKANPILKTHPLCEKHRIVRLA